MLLVAVLRLPARLGRYVPAATAAALVVGIVLVANFALAHGSSFGLRLAQDSFDEGIDLDTLLLALQLALLVFALAGVRRQVATSNSQDVVPFGARLVSPAGDQRRRQAVSPGSG